MSDLMKLVQTFLNSRSPRLGVAFAVTSGVAVFWVDAVDWVANFYPTIATLCLTFFVTWLAVEFVVWVWGGIVRWRKKGERKKSELASLVWDFLPSRAGIGGFSRNSQQGHEIISELTVIYERMKELQIACPTLLPRGQVEDLDQHLSFLRAMQPYLRNQPLKSVLRYASSIVTTSDA